MPGLFGHPGKAASVAGRDEQGAGGQSCHSGHSEDLNSALGRGEMCGILSSGWLAPAAGLSCRLPGAGMDQENQLEMPVALPGWRQ